jgi:hypothetical protein
MRRACDCTRAIRGRDEVAVRGVDWRALMDCYDQAAVALDLSTPFAESAKSPSDSVTTPAARWREKGEPDPHGDSYDCERAKLCGGHLTDDEVAHQAAMLMRGDLNHEAVLQTAKDRIRWLSRQLVAARAALQSIKDQGNG